MKKNIKLLVDALEWCLAISAGIIILDFFVYFKMDSAFHRGHEYFDIEFCQNVLQRELNLYVADERYSAVADTDEKMRAYKTIDEIIETELCFYNETEGLKDTEPYNYCLEKIFEGRKEYGKNPYERLPGEQRFGFEEEVVRSLELYIQPQGDGWYIEPRHFKGCQLWTWIQGSYEEGYTVMVLPYKKDPFSEVR